jgi:transketolase
LLGDGECDEGSNWEAIMFAAHHKLTNLVTIVDHNKLQCIDTVANILNLEPFVAKWQSFGWEVKEVAGHDHEQLAKAFTNIPANPDKPTCVLAHTTKGKGVSFMENSVLWHNKSLQSNEYIQAIEEINKNL